MIRRFAPLALVLAVAACANPFTRAQSIFVAYGSYSAALRGAVAYANSPSANPAIVHRLNAANQRPEVKTAVRYGRAYTSCLGDNETVVEGIDCKAFDFRPGTAAGYAATLRAVVVTLTTR